MDFTISEGWEDENRNLLENTERNISLHRWPRNEKRHSYDDALDRHRNRLNSLKKEVIDMRLLEYLRGFKRDERYRIISSHPKSTERYAKEVNRYTKALTRKSGKLTVGGKISVPQFNSSFSNKFR